MIWGGPLRFIAWTFGLLLFLAAILWWTGTARAVALQPSRPLDNAECLGCHAQPWTESTMALVSEAVIRMPLAPSAMQASTAETWLS